MNSYFKLTLNEQTSYPPPENLLPQNMKNRFQSSLKGCSEQSTAEEEGAEEARSTEEGESTKEARCTKKAVLDLA
jgi:hypothetical protein